MAYMKHCKHCGIDYWWSPSQSHLCNAKMEFLIKGEEIMKTTEVKFKTRSELYAWLATGKPIYLSGRKYVVADDRRYTIESDHSDAGLDCNDELSLYSGIEEIPTKKAYAYWSWVDDSLKHLIFMETDDKIAKKGLERAPEFDLEGNE